jgi:protein O-mannosyl-transferase
MDATETRRTTLPRGWALLPALLAVALYLPALGAPFVFDDFETVVQNPSFAPHASWKLVLIYTFRPLVNVALALQHAVFGENVAGYHVVSLLLHALNVLGVFALVRGALEDGRSVRSRVTPLLAATVFALHPLQTQAVAYISQGSELFALGFVLLSLLRFRTWVRHGALGVPGEIWLWVVLGLLCKETAAVAPLLIAAYDGLFLKDVGRRPRWLRVHVPLLGLVAAGAGVRVLLWLRFEAATLPRGLGEHAFTQVYVWAKYGWLFAVPVGQSLIHELLPVVSLSDPRAGFFLLWLGLGVGAWLLRSRAPLESFGIAWWLFALLPSSVIPLMERMAEHRAYLPSVGACCAIAGLLGALEARWLQRPWVMGPAVLWAILSLGTLTHRRLALWRSPVALWKDAAAHAPQTWAAHYALGDAYRVAGDCPNAIPAYQRAISLDAREPRPYTNLGICLATTGELSQAEGALRRAVTLSPRDVRPYNNLANVKILQEDLPGARLWVDRALQIDPANPQTHQLAVMLGLVPP